ncbi:nuclear transport factor 2 family protein [Bradyrhizobium diazoefficiens]|uniref:nuclear transport factor 2 family protein n=1 Tax=Bradyrhizobium diazoefficiens TaxID=1355477 RepID=UPI0006855ED4|nr:nuclear transport factor 2 family protein [Bradyrhizobium diazoefficiens]
MAQAQDENHGTQWTNAFEEKSETAFADALAEDVVLEAAALVKPVVGREKVKLGLTTASKLYERVVFTSNTTVGDNTWMQWEATIPGGTELKGVTVLTRNSWGHISRIGIYHSPLSAMLTFSEEMGIRTRDSLGPGYFFRN